ncbi:single strand DNA binding protein [Serratia phage CHI14]|uniref:Single-stranded DNA-binding protein n=1 Tax=Serratia phage CHI14 TaxID=2006941 RepID=A0A1Z1LXY1_9CAUD|nr:single strand DNA binding protein [Serratia phage CHI14]ARW57667.1 single-stranded DNA binding protein [Serratia phage CHI14]UYM28895.1 single stranded DNA binding protein [Serratia phage vB_SspM_LC53]
MFKRKDPAALQAQLASLKGGSGFSSDDKNEWKLKDDNGNGMAVIRFLPGKGDEGLPFVKLVNHGFKKNGKWYIENCSSTHGDFDNCPVCQHLSKNDSYNTNKPEYQLLKRKTSYWANILVIQDKANPETEGKVFKFRFGQKVYDKITAMVEVDTSIGEVPVDVTCPFDGANFVLKTKKVGDFKNYDDSKFLGQSEIPNITDETFQKFLEENMSDLSELTAKDKFKALDVLQKKFEQVMGVAAMGGAASKAAAQADAIGDSLDSFDKDMAAFDSKPSTPASSGAEEDDLDALLADM